MAWICTDDKQCANGGKCLASSLDGKSCQCADGYLGARCDIEMRENEKPSGSFSTCKVDGSDCQNGGTCVEAKEIYGGASVNANYCRCPQGTFGAKCHGKEEGFESSSKNDSVVHVCSDNGEKCQNGGVCVLSNSGNYCQCPEGYSGKFCHGHNVCPLKCEHGSSCRHKDELSTVITGSGMDSSNFYCECVGGYKGLTCHIPFQTCPKLKNEAAPLECLYGGECLAPSNPNESYTCSCPDDRSGKNCESGAVSTIEDYNGSCYHDDDCAHGGLCVRDHDAETTAKTGMLTKETHCLCGFGYGGDNCEFFCESLICKHGSSCRFPKTDDVTHSNIGEVGAYCECLDGWKGKECEIQVEKCPGKNSMECLYGGACVGAEDDRDGDKYFCMCPKGRTGVQCEKLIADTASKPTTTVHNNNKNSSKISSGSSSSAVALVAICVTLAIAILVPLTLIWLRRKRLRKEISNETVSETLDDAFSSPSKGAADSVNDSVEHDDDDIFDYDTQGVVDINLDENEPVALSKEKQIV